ncbi:hypothetical protein ACFS5L_03640 [Streptomyces phyllanthi]|uniref:HEAT repeat domain-containing protein n=1 Tax=Streptomyces phyllanthi TaxID=1803180 RepID=A0A5N8WCY9_9ACTN|nr:hypothetical protein [Streptomyces phyllanthi]MPY44015.1 hypothetical protein [Streptomyces phyllanthi]
MGSQGEAARAAARETAEEREAAQESLFRGPGPTERLLREWLEGLGTNPSAPDEVRCRLLGRAYGFLWHKQPAAVVEAALAHPDWKVRGGLADPRLSPASAVRLLDDPRATVRHTATTHPRLPARVLVRLLRDRDTAGTAARNPALPVPVMHRMTGLHPKRPGSRSPHVQ